MLGKYFRNQYDELFPKQHKKDKKGKGFERDKKGKKGKKQEPTFKVGLYSGSRALELISGVDSFFGARYRYRRSVHSRIFPFPYWKSRRGRRRDCSVDQSTEQGERLG